MSENRTRGVMIFVLGLVLLIIGIAISAIAKTEIIYQNYYGFQLPVGSRTVYPYLEFGIPMIIFGVIAVSARAS
jgi:hypothetical protein